MSQAKNQRQPEPQSRRRWPSNGGVAEPDRWQSRVCGMKRLPAESRQCLQPTLDALLPAILDQIPTA